MTSPSEAVREMYQEDLTVWPKNGNGFTATNHALVWPVKGKAADIRRIYEVTDDTIQWDIPEVAKALEIGEKIYAMGTTHGVYGYVILRMSGRKQTIAPIGGYGMRYRVTGNLSKNGIDQETWTAHVVKNYWN